MYRLRLIEFVHHLFFPAAAARSYLARYCCLTDVMHELRLSKSNSEKTIRRGEAVRSFHYDGRYILRIVGLLKGVYSLSLNFVVE